MPIIEINDHQQNHINGACALIYFYSQRCPNCRGVSHIVKTVSKTHPRLKVAKVDVDKSPLITNRFQIKTVPTLMGYRDESTLFKRSGGISLGELDRLINESLDSQQ